MGVLDILSGLLSGSNSNSNVSSGGADNLLQNKLFLQYAVAAGQDINSGNPIGTNVNAVTNQAITAQNTDKKYTALLKRLLGPDETKGTFSNKGLSLDIPQSALKGGTFLNEDPLGLTTNSQPQQLTSNPQVGTANPFADSQLENTSASDLAGLSAQDLGNIFNSALNVERLKQQKVSDVVDSLYKQKQMENIDSEIANRGDVVFPVLVPGVGRVTNKQWSSLPEDDREYAIYVQGAKALGDGIIMSKSEWKMIEPTERERFTRAVMKDPRLMQAAKELNPPGVNINLDTKVAEMKALSSIDRQNKVRDPEFAQKIIKNLRGQGSKWHYPLGVEDIVKKYNLTEDKAIEVIQRSKVREEMNNQIKQSYPNANWVAGKGWVVDNEVIVRDPYVK